MEKYKNLGGDSNVNGYEFDADSITIEFKTGKLRFYLYDSVNPGGVYVTEMKRLAVQGHGLNSYIGKNLRSASSYSKKW